MEILGSLRKISDHAPHEHVHHTSRVEFTLAIVITLALVASLVSERYNVLPKYVTPLLILAFLAVKVFHIMKKGGTLLEDYTAIAAIVVFLGLYFILKGSTNPILITVFVFILLYSTGLILWVRNTFGSKKLTHFVISYILTIVMTIFLFTGAYSSNPSLFAENSQPATLNFEDMMYFSTITITTLGYGDIIPKGINKLLASLEALAGMIINVALLGYVLSRGREHDPYG